MIRLGARRVLAASCRKCGKLVPGQQFDYHIRRARDAKAYIDQRCVNCKWGAKRK